MVLLNLVIIQLIKGHFMYLHAAAQWTGPLPLQIVTYEGCSALFPWNYNSSLGHPTELAITKSGVSPQTLLYKAGSSDPVARNGRVSFLANSGMRVDNLTVDDSGLYEVRLNFEQKELAVHHQISLNVKGLVHFSVII